MISGNNIQRVFVKPDNTATIHCPVCQLAKTVAVDKFRATKHTVTARCACNHSFSVSLEFRKNYRIKTALPGTYEVLKSEIDDKHGKRTKLTGVFNMEASATGCGHIQVTNISSGGLQFSTLCHYAITVGDQARITFTLDDRKQTKIDKRVIIQTVNANIIGCRFASNETLEKGLRFYLFP